MDVLIKNMEMPKEDDVVIMTLDSNGSVNIFGKRLLSLLSPHAEVHGLRVAVTDAIELPPYGKLGDLDALLRRVEAIDCFGDPDETIDRIIQAIENAPTIVEANT